MKKIIAVTALMLPLQCKALDLVPDIDVLSNSIKASDATTQSAVQNATKAFFIQSGFKASYDNFRTSTNNDGEHEKNIIAYNIDNHTYLSHDEVFGALLVGFMIAKKTASTSFADPYAHWMKHYITVSQNEVVTGIRWNF